MKLLLVQHGENISETVDPEKPLSAKGRRDVEALASACRIHGVKCQEILHSGKLRARQTAEILGTALAVPVLAHAGLDPLDPVRPFAEECGKWTGDRAVVGHLPFMERLTAFLVAGREEPPVVAFQRGGMVCLEKRAEKRGAGDWLILWTLLPDQPGTAAGQREIPSDQGA